MKRNLLLVLVCGVVCALFASVVPAQNPEVMSAANERYIISAKAGGTNFVEGTVTVVRKTGKSGYLLKGDQLEIGDTVTTAANGKVEILLNPGSYVRLGGNSTFEFTTTSLDDLRLKLTKGSAIFEVFASEEFEVSVEAPKGKISLVQSGVYRVDVLADGTAKIAVTKGRAEVGDDDAVVKNGRQAVVNGTTAANITKFDDDNGDSLDVWSKGRSKELSRVSQQVQRGNMRTSLMRSFLGRGWNMYNSFGLWAYDPFYRSYCFLPFGYGWRSPYGWGFGPSIGWYNLPPVVYTPPAGGGSSLPTNNTPIAQTPRNPDGRQPPLSGGGGALPPFAQIQNDSSAGSSIRGGGGGKGGGFSHGQFDVSTPSGQGPIYSPPASSAPVYAPSTRSDAPPKASSGNRDN